MWRRQPEPGAIGVIASDGLLSVKGPGANDSNGRAWVRMLSQLAADNCSAQRYPDYRKGLALDDFCGCFVQQMPANGGRATGFAPARRPRRAVVSRWVESDVAGLRQLWL